MRSILVWSILLVFVATAFGAEEETLTDLGDEVKELLKKGQAELQKANRTRSLNPIRSALGFYSRAIGKARMYEKRLVSGEAEVVDFLIGPKRSLEQAYFGKASALYMAAGIKAMKGLDSVPNFKGAIAALNSALEVNEKSNPSRVMLGTTRFQYANFLKMQGKPEAQTHFAQAEADFDKAIELHPKKWQGYAWKAQSLAMGRKLNEAVAMTKKALAINPNLASAGLGPAMSLLIQEAKRR